METAKLILEIDADYAPYAFGSYPEWDAIVRTDAWLQYIYDQLGTENSVIFISGDGNYRYDIAVTKPYKGNRAEKEKPKSYDAIREHLASKDNCLIAQGMEADDAIMIVANAHKAQGLIPVRVSDDKDFLQEVGWNYRHTKNILMDVKHEIKLHQSVKFNDDGFPVYNSYYGFYGDYLIWHQMLIGDTADNIPGVPGIGAKNKIFDRWYKHDYTVDQCKAAVMTEYVKYYGINAIDVFREQYYLLHLIRHNDNI